MLSSKPLQTQTLSDQVVIRTAQTADLPLLNDLETVCWAAEIRADQAELSARLSRYAQGQKVLLYNNQLVGAVYSQRIHDPKNLDAHHFRSVHQLHQNDGPILQLIAVNVLPQFQPHGFGDLLINHMLEFAQNDPDTQAVVAVTLCRDYRAEIHGDLTAFIRARDDQNLPPDPILRFHVLHGAEIVGLQKNYRPQDHHNLGHGVLVRYDLEQLAQRRQKSAAPTITHPPAQVKQIVETTVRGLLSNGVPFRGDRAFRDLGLDSLGLYTLRMLLNERLGKHLDADIFFRFSNADALANYLAGDLPTAQRTTRQTPLPAPQVLKPTPTTDLPTDAIAVIGIACRFPGAENLDAFYDLLLKEESGIGELPENRPQRQRFLDAQLTTTRGGYLTDIDQFDGTLFPISEREIQAMDPQQRILLEINRAALEHAGISPENVGQVGFYCGIYGHDYELISARDREADQLSAYHGTGTASSMAAGRMAYLFGSQAPAMVVDTACSSSLVALHLAVKALRNGEAPVAVASGSNLILSPELSASFSQAGMLSPQARCATFDSEADGYVRAEGCAAVVLKPLAQAVADGDHIWGVIRGTAVNQDGAGNGLTAPNGAAQEKVIRAALADADLNPADIDYVEAHGTGTVLGDAVELAALGSVFGENRAAEQALLLGSVKSNIGHTEATAGLAGLIKTCLALFHRRLPANLHYRAANREFDPARIPARVLNQAHDLEADRIYRAGISSFGFSGTNAHVILETPPRSTTGAGVQEPQLWTLSAASETALKKTAAAVIEQLKAETDIDLAAFAQTTALGRAHLPFRLAGVAADRAQLLAGLSESASPAEDGSAPLAFLFSGQGAQYPGMAADLYNVDPYFREQVDQCDRILRESHDLHLLDVLFAENQSQAALIHQTGYTQPALFVIEYALAMSFRRWGIEPDWVMGHSVGEYAAAVFAGVMSLEDGLKLITARGRFMQALPENGAMAAVLSDGESVGRVLNQLGVTVDIAAYNGPQNTVISGPKAGVQAACEQFAAMGIRAVPLTVSHAFHSSLMEPMLAAFSEVAASIRFSKPNLALVSNLSGSLAGDEITSPEYWVNHVRQPVAFQQGVTFLQDAGCRFYLETGPKPVLLGMARRCLNAGESIFQPAMNPGEENRRHMLEALAELYRRGRNIDFQAIFADRPRRRIPLPTYAYDRQPYWLPEPGNLQPTVKNKGLIPRKIDTPLPTDLYELHLQGRAYRYFDDHRAYGRAIFPAAAYLEAALHVAADQQTTGISQLQLHAPLMWSPDDGLKLQLHYQPEQTDLTFYGKAGDEESWTSYGQLRLGNNLAKPAPLRNTREQEENFEPTSLYDDRQDVVPYFGPSFRGIKKLSRQGNRYLGQVIGDRLQEQDKNYRFHPALLDACLQVAAQAANREKGAGELPFLLASLETFTLWEAPGSELQVEAKLIPSQGNHEALVDLDIYNANGQAVASARGLHFKRARLPKPISQNLLNDLLYQQVSIPRTPHASGLEPIALDPLSKALGNPEPKETNVVALVPEIERLSRAYILQALQQLGYNFEQPQPRKGWPGLETIASQHKRLCNRLTDILIQAGDLRLIDDHLIAEKVTTENPDNQRRDLLKQFPDAEHELAILGRCGNGLANVLTGKQDPLTLIFPDGEVAGTADLYEKAPAFAPSGARVASVIKAALQHIPENRKLRVLEIGAGTGGTTAHVLPVLGDRYSEYVFTDITPYFSRRLSERFSQYPRLRFQVLDLEKEPQENQRYDLIIAANVVHATRDLHQSLSHIRAMSAPDGLVLLQEGTAPRAWIDLIFGLTEGWWRFIDTDLRPDYPLLQGEQWCRLFNQTGFADQRALEPEHDMLFPQAVLVARNQARRAPKTLIIDNAQGQGTPLAELVEDATVVPGNATFSNLEPFLAAAPDQVLFLTDVLEADPNHLDYATRVLEQSDRLLNLSQALLRHGRSTRLRIAAKSDPTSPLAFALRGFIDVLRQEHPELQPEITLIHAESEEVYQNLLSDHLKDTGPTCDLRAPKGNYQNHLQRYPLDRTKTVDLKAQATYLISGGLGELGLKTAEALCSWGAGRIILLGRSTPNPAKQKTIANLAQGGTRIETVAVDIGDAAAVATLFTELKTANMPLKGIIHAAGSFDDHLILDQNREHFAQVFRAKVDGALNLHRNSLDLDLDFFVLYGSAMTLLPTPGLSNYVAANRFLDGLATYRRAQGLPGHCIGWGPWQDLGMARAVSDRRREQWRAMGLSTISAEAGTAALQAVLADPDTPTQLGVVAVDWQTFARRQGAQLADFYRDMEVAESKTASHLGAHHSDFAAIKNLAPEQREQAFEQALRQLTAEVMAIAPDKLKADLGLFQQGMDSLSSLELRGKLQAHLQLTLAPTLLFKFPSLRKLCAYLLPLALPDTAEVHLQEEHAVELAASELEKDGLLDDLDLDGDLLEADLSDLEALLKE